MPPPDPAMIRSAQRDRAQFAAIYEHYVQPVFRYLFSRVGNRQDAEELTAQTFLAALESLPGYRHSGAFSAWLFSIARRKAADHFRRQSRAGHPASPDEVEQLAAVSAQGQLELAALIAGLPATERELLQLRYVADLSFVEIGALLGRKPDTVKKSVYRLLARLQAEMESPNE